MEIGVEAGRSMKSWPLYFKNANHIFGIGYGTSNEWQEKGEQDCGEMMVGHPGKCTLFKGDQSNNDFLHYFLNVSGGNFDFIIDDASHVPFHQARLSI